MRLLDSSINSFIFQMVSKASPECLILAPTRELALQIHNEARKVSSRF
jgi:superfamily II DNA/RNA helicase